MIGRTIVPTRQPIESNLPAVISVSAMAKKCGLGRSRFYELIEAGIFPHPVYDLRTRRPMFLTEQQVECLRVRTTSIGRNGQFILFYAPRQRTQSVRSPRVAGGAGSRSNNNEIVEGL